MKYRIALYIFLSTVFGVLLITFATALQTGYSALPADWLRAHSQSPLLRLLDFCAVWIVLFMSLTGRLLNLATERLHARAADLQRFQQEHQKQVEELIRHAEEMDQVYTSSAGRVEELEKELVAQHEAFEAHAQRLTEQAFSTLQEQVAEHTRQLNAVNVALQYHRAELAQLRHGLRSLQADPESFQRARLSSAEQAALAERGINALPNASHAHYALESGRLESGRLDTEPAVDALEAVAVQAANVSAVIKAPTEQTDTETLPRSMPENGVRPENGVKVEDSIGLRPMENGNAPQRMPAPSESSESRVALGTDAGSRPA